MSPETVAAIKWAESHNLKLSNIEWVGIYKALLREIKAKDKK